MKKYNKYKDSGIEWIGEIPSHWEVKKVKHSFTFKTGFTPPTGKSEYYENGNHVWINISDLQEKYIEDSSNKITDKAIKDYNPEIVEKGSLLYSFKLSVGRVGFNTIDCYTNEAIFAIDPNSSANLHFFYYSLPEQIIKNANENIYGAKILNQELIKNAFLVVPPPKEQTAITNYLDRKTAEIDELIADKKRLLELYEEEKTAIINQAVTGKTKACLGSKDVKMKDSGIEWLGEIPEHWEVALLKRFCKVTDGSHYSPKTQEEGMPYISVKDIGENTIDLINCKKISIDDFNTLIKNGCSPKEGDILLTKDGTIGRAAIVTAKHDPFVILSSLGLITPNEKLISKYLYYYLISGINIDQMYSFIHGSALTRLTIEKINNLLFTIPPIVEQQSIVNYIETETARIDSKISKTEKLIELLTEYRTALISEVVTGKVKVI